MKPPKTFLSIQFSSTRLACAGWFEHQSDVGGEIIDRMHHLIELNYRRHCPLSTALWLGGIEKAGQRTPPPPEKL